MTITIASHTLRGQESDRTLLSDWEDLVTVSLVEISMFSAAEAGCCHAVYTIHCYSNRLFEAVHDSMEGNKPTSALAQASPFSPPLKYSFRVGT